MKSIHFFPIRTRLRAAGAVLLALASLAYGPRCARAQSLYINIYGKDPQSSDAPISDSYSGTDRYGGYFRSAATAASGSLFVSSACGVVPAPGGDVGPVQEYAACTSSCTEEIALPFVDPSYTCRLTLHFSGARPSGTPDDGAGAGNASVGVALNDPEGSLYSDSTNAPGSTPIPSTFTRDFPCFYGEVFFYYRIGVTSAGACPDEAHGGHSASARAAGTLSRGSIVILDPNGKPVDYSIQPPAGAAKAVTYPANTSYDTFTLTNAAAGSNGTSVQLLGGTASAPTQVVATFVPPPPPTTDIKPLSDVLELAGTNSDLVVVKMTYDAVKASGLAGAFAYLQLGTYETSTGQWKIAILGNDGNTGSTRPTFFDRGYEPATDFHLGYYGVDRQAGYVWAVVNHGGQFGVIPHASFFDGEVALGQGVSYLAFPGNGNVFGYYQYLSEPGFLYHFDLGYEYVFDLGNGGVVFYDFKSNDYYYTSPTFAFPYLYDFGLNAFLYYYPDPNNPQRYNTNGVRYFFNFSTGKVISK